MVEVVVLGLGEGLLGPGADEADVFVKQNVDLVALPREGAAVIGAGGEQGVDLAAGDEVAGVLGNCFGEEAPLVEAEGFDVEREAVEGLPQQSWHN